MTPAAELCPVTDGVSTARADAMQRPGLTLYALTDDLAQLLAIRAEMAEAKEDTAAVDAEIERYMEQLPEKVDAVVHVLRTLESQAQLAVDEIARITARRRQISSAIEHLKRYCCVVLEQQPKPKRGSRKLEGGSSTLALVGNGGVEPLDISDESLVPDECCEAIVRMPWTVWDCADKVAVGIMPNMVKVERAVSNTAIRKALATPCWACEGKCDDDNPCSLCGNTGRAGVPGARLLERGAHLEIR